MKYCPRYQIVHCFSYFYLELFPGYKRNELSNEVPLCLFDFIWFNRAKFTVILKMFSIRYKNELLWHKLINSCFSNFNLTDRIYPMVNLIGDKGVMKDIGCENF